jgi:predicted metalloprotease with PDZ domain
VKSRNELNALAIALAGIPIWGVFANSAAAEAGLRYGDVVLAVNGHKISNVDEYFAARELRKDGASMLVYRDGVASLLELVFEPSRPALSDQDLLAEMIEQRMLPGAQGAASSRTSESAWRFPLAKNAVS